MRCRCGAPIEPDEPMCVACWDAGGYERALDRDVAEERERRRRARIAAARNRLPNQVAGGLSVRERYGREHFRNLARLSARKRAGSTDYAALGRRGGSATFARYGAAHMAATGRLAHQ